MRQDRIKAERQAAYREAHRDRARRRGEPAGRDVGAALVELYAEAAVQETTPLHRGLVARLVAKGFDRDASMAFVERLVRRARVAAEDDVAPPAQC